MNSQIDIHRTCWMWYFRFYRKLFHFLFSLTLPKHCVDRLLTVQSVAFEKLLFYRGEIQLFSHSSHSLFLSFIPTAFYLVQVFACALCALCVYILNVCVCEMNFRTDTKAISNFSTKVNGIFVDCLSNFFSILTVLHLLSAHNSFSFSHSLCRTSFKSYSIQTMSYLFTHTHTVLIHISYSVPIFFYVLFN